MRLLPGGFRCAPVSIQDFGNGFGSQTVVEVVVDLDGRRPAACANAFHFFERKRSVGSHAFMSNSKLVLEALVNIVSSAQHATDVGADLDVVLAGRLEAEHRVIGSYISNVEFGNPDAVGNFRNHGVGKI